MAERIIIADDITGASGIATLFSSNGLNVGVYLERAKDLNIDLDILVIDTDSRFFTPEKAYNKVYDVTKRMKDLGNKYYFHKTCTVFRGNVGSELDAILDATGERHAYMVPGFPDNLRTLKNSIAYVNEIPAARSHYKDDPMNPITESNLIKVLENHSNRKVVGFTLKDLRKSIKHCKEKLKELEKVYDIILFDVEDNKDLEKITELIYDKKIIGGSSALGRTLGKRITSNKKKNKQQKLMKYHLGVLGLSASITPKTKKQIHHLKNTEIEILKISPYESYYEKNYIKEIIKLVIKKIQLGTSLMIHTDNEDLKIERTNKLFEREGYTKAEQSFYITNLLAEIAFNVKKETKLNRFFIAGGDTSSSFSKKLKINGFEILDEIDIGLSSMMSLTEPKNLVVFKSGNFGKVEFIEKAFQYLIEY